MQVNKDNGIKGAQINGFKNNVDQRCYQDMTKNIQEVMIT